MKPEEKMNCLDLVQGTVLKMDQTTFTHWKDTLVGRLHRLQ